MGRINQTGNIWPSWYDVINRHVHHSWFEQCSEGIRLHAKLYADPRRVLFIPVKLDVVHDHFYLNQIFSLHIIEKSLWYIFLNDRKGYLFLENMNLSQFWLHLQLTGDLPSIVFVSKNVLLHVQTMGNTSLGQWYCQQCSGYDQVDELPPERRTERDERECDEPHPCGHAARPPGQASPQLHLLAARNDWQNDGGHVRIRMEKRPLSRWNVISNTQ